MDGSPQSGSFRRNHPMALRCRRVGAVHSINRVEPNEATVSSDVCFAPKADKQADISFRAAAVR